MRLRLCKFVSPPSSACIYLVFLRHQPISSTISVFNADQSSHTIHFTCGDFQTGLDVFGAVLSNKTTSTGSAANLSCRLSLLPTSQVHVWTPNLGINHSQNGVPFVTTPIRSLPLRRNNPPVQAFRPLPKMLFSLSVTGLA
jgi:hypothetical protein